MVDAVTTGAGGTANAAVASVARPVPTTPVAQAAPSPSPAPAPTSEPQLAALARAVAASAPVDTDRVAQIKAALANGTFPILPATIADQMMAFRYEWMSNGPKSHD